MAGLSELIVYIGKRRDSLMDKLLSVKERAQLAKHVLCDKEVHNKVESLSELQSDEFIGMYCYSGVSINLFSVSPRCRQGEYIM